MKKIKLFTFTIVSFVFTINLPAQRMEVYVINETNSTFQSFSFKSSKSKNWEAITIPEETDEYLQALKIYVDTSDNCLIDFRANDGLEEYKWFKIDLCNAVEVSLFVEDDGSSAYRVTYEESEYEEEDDEGSE